MGRQSRHDWFGLHSVLLPLTISNINVIAVSTVDHLAHLRAIFERLSYY